MLAEKCQSFKAGAAKLYEDGAKADMWFFELYHHLNECGEALYRAARAQELQEDRDMKAKADRLEWDALIEGARK